MHPGEVITVYMKFDLPTLPASMVIPSTNRAAAMGLQPQARPITSMCGTAISSSTRSTT